jgi:hypothetical protein
VGRQRGRKAGEGEVRVGAAKGEGGGDVAGGGDGWREDEGADGARVAGQSTGVTTGGG